MAYWKMTISYSGNSSTLLCKWKGSTWKASWKELILFLFFYYVIRFSYSYAMTEEQQEYFEFVVQVLNKQLFAYPTIFILGFYVYNTMERWWMQFDLISWPEDFLCALSLCFPAESERDRLILHTISRYCSNFIIFPRWQILWPSVFQKVPLRYRQ